MKSIYRSFRINVLGEIYLQVIENKTCYIYQLGTIELSIVDFTYLFAFTRDLSMKSMTSMTHVIHTSMIRMYLVAKLYRSH